MLPDDLNMSLETAVARLRQGHVVTCDHNVLEAATRKLLADGINPHWYAVNSELGEHDAQQRTASID